MNDNIRETGEDASVNTYLNLFGPIFGRGKTYLRYILGYYIRNDCQAGDADYEHFIVKAAADRNISPADIIIAINHYIRKSWVQFADAWKMYTAWTEETAPPAATAVRLLCEGFVPFTCSYGKAASILQTFSRKSAIRSIEKTHLPLVDVGQFTEFERDIIESNLLVNLDDDEVYAYAGYLSYRVERDLYELLQEYGKLADLTWEEFLCIIVDSDYLIDSIKKVFTQTLAASSKADSFDFGVKDVVIPQQEDGNEKFIFAPLYSREEVVCLVNSIFYKAEVAYYKKMQQLNCSMLSWDKYVISLSAKEEPWMPLVMAFRDALMRMDFKPVWRTADFED